MLAMPCILFRLEETWVLRLCGTSGWSLSATMDIDLGGKVLFELSSRCVSHNRDGGLSFSILSASRVSLFCVFANDIYQRDSTLQY